ncbi:hypothetical protein NKH18_49730 [Streptomyces sp. M10(2022)]
MSVRNRRLDVLADKAALSSSGTGNASGPRAFNRPTLRQVMLSGLRDHVHYGARLVAYQHEANGTVTARFADGRTASADLLVGADGVNSAVRRILLPDARVEDAGLRLVYGKIPLEGHPGGHPGLGLRQHLHGGNRRPRPSTPGPGPSGVQQSA